MESNNGTRKPYRLVTLTKWERHQASTFGYLRWEEAEKERRQNKLLKPDKLLGHVEGVLGETAYAKDINVYYTPTVNTFKKPDVNGRQVRCRSQHDWELIVRPDDPNDEPFVLVTMDWREPDKFRVYHGEIWGREAKLHREWFEDHGDYGKPAYFVPQEFLFEQWLRSQMPVNFEIPPRDFRLDTSGSILH